MSWVRPTLARPMVETINSFDILCKATGDEIVTLCSFKIPLAADDKVSFTNHDKQSESEI